MKWLIITKKELSLYFGSLTAYIISTVFLLISGWFFTSNIFILNLATMRTVIELMPFLFLFLIPALTMGSFTEERKDGTIELLFTMPISDFDLILGKFFSALVFILFLLLFTASYPITISILGDPDNGQLITQYIAVILLAATYISIGICVSSFSTNQVVSFIVTFLILFFFFIIDKFVPLMPYSIGKIFYKIAIMPKFSHLLKGVIDSTDLVYFITLILIFLGITQYSLERRHWNG